MNKTFIIAEAGVNHNGRLDLAFRLCDAAKAAGADAVKFQTWVTEKIVTADTAMAAYQQRNLASEESQFRMLKALELSYAQFAEIKRYCDTLGITFLSTGDNPEDIATGMYVRHLGIYAYRGAFLRKFIAEKPCELEKTEKLEQLRALWMGGKIAVIRTEDEGVGVDTPEDAERVGKILAGRQAAE